LTKDFKKVKLILGKRQKYDAVSKIAKQFWRSKYG